MTQEAKLFLAYLQATANTKNAETLLELEKDLNNLGNPKGDGGKSIYGFAKDLNEVSQYEIVSRKLNNAIALLKKALKVITNGELYSDIQSCVNDYVGNQAITVDSENNIKGNFVIFDCIAQSKEILNSNNTRIAYEDEDEIVFEDCSKAGLWNYIMSAKLGKECFGTYLIVFKNKFKSVDKSE